MLLARSVPSLSTDCLSFFPSQKEGWVSWLYFWELLKGFQFSAGREAGFSVTRST